MLFSGSVASNVTLGQENAVQEDIEKALAISQSEGVVSRMSGGVDAEIARGGVNVSAGQRQLVTIARAMIEDAPLLILDEATSSVDTKTELAVQEAMNKLMDGRTSFVIAHQLSTIRNADLILVMQQGDIVESGYHAQLMAQNGVYARLYNSQFEEE